MPEHLLLPDRRLVSSRRAGSGGAGPARDRAKHGAVLRQQLDSQVRAPNRLGEGVDPDLVFRIRADGMRFEDTADLRGIVILGETRDHTYVVLSQDEGAKLRAALDGYTDSGTLGSILDRISAIEPYGPADRRGPGLDDLHEGEGPFLVDVLIWPSPDFAEAQRRAWIVQAVLAEVGAVEVLRNLTARRNLMRVSVTRSGLDAVLATSVIESVRTPPVPFLDYRDWRSRDAAELQRIAVASAEVGVLDDAPATEHPLIRGLVASVDAIGSADYPWTAASQHGTEVVGRVLFPWLHEELRDGAPISAHGLVRVARILEPDPTVGGIRTRFAARNFPHELVEQGIRTLHARYGVRVFNLSLGYAEPFADAHVEPLTEVIDELVRELDIVVVVPTGNAPPSALGKTPSDHHVAEDYAAYLDAPEHRLAEPGPAALAITVGSIAHSAAPAEVGDASARFAWQAVANVDELSPFSRTGPGVGANLKRRNKPDVVHYGGNVVLNDSGLVSPNEMGSSVVSTSLDPTRGTFFAACNGTSYAAPAVARVAADILHAYPGASANLVRALLAMGARLPAGARDIPEDHRVAALFGLGRPDADRSINSGGERATMMFEGSLDVDTVAIHPVPVPDDFRTGRRSRSITVTLAFDPPVRRTRREYLGASMQIDLYRNVDIDELANVLARQERDARLPAINDRRRANLLPGSDASISSTLQSRTWKVAKSFVDDDDVFLLAVTHRATTWMRDNPEYTAQRYALAVTLEDQQQLGVDLRQALLQRVKLPARLRLRG